MKFLYLTLIALVTGISLPTRAADAGAGANEQIKAFGTTISGVEQLAILIGVHGGALEHIDTKLAALNEKVVHLLKTDASQASAAEAERLDLVERRNTITEYLDQALAILRAKRKFQSHIKQ